MRIAPDIDVDDQALADVCDRYGIAELRVFGSRARGTAGPGSRVDTREIGDDSAPRSMPAAKRRTAVFCRCSKPANFAVGGIGVCPPSSSTKETRMSAYCVMLSLQYVTLK